jgi:hypothetical protein
VSDFDSEIFDRALAEIVGEAPVPRSERGGWSLRSRTPLIELDDLSPDWWAARARLCSTRTSVRSPRVAQRRRRPASSVSRVELRVARILRHADPRVTLTVYAGVAESQLASLGDDLQAAFR